MSFDAIRWALAQDVGKSATKFVLVALADHVNAEAAEWVCWPSYRALAAMTLQDTKTVEAAVYRLKESGHLVDTGERKGDTRKVVVYRLNDPKSGFVTPGPQAGSANTTRVQNGPKTGPIPGNVNPPGFPPNPPKSPEKSPQISDEIPPKTGYGTRDGTRNGTGKEAERAGAPTIPGVAGIVIADWMPVRKAKRAGPITQTVIDILVREAEKAGLTTEEAVRYCCGAGWQNFNAGHYANRESGYGRSTARTQATGKYAAAARTIFGNQPPDYIDA